MLVRHPLSGSFSPLLLRMLRSQTAKPNQGLTLIECLVAIVLIAITVVAITPPIFVATASRIQSRRVEQANQIAQAEVDRVRVVMERVPTAETQLPPTGTGVASGPNLSALASTVGDCGTGINQYPSPTAQAPSTSVIPVDIDDDCIPEFAMQVFRENDCKPIGSPATVPPYSFDLTVRVYGYKTGDAMTNLDAKRMTLGLTTGRAGDDPTTGALRKPLQVLSTRVSRVGDVDSVQCVVRS
ncbi:type II secretion system protein [Phormidium sp. CLA17]|uniref:type II secretion system protein n=1 Tax=Leptolyngbya sp. Cla-17 TaxID=2803751 RepID=UPI0014931045|nr:type II secretion system protein [Leptolyngbya sp. Cla-17]MBM0743267.1 type II secretion system protein [Leptolyngbya sp. Cla-17]